MSETTKPGRKDIAYLLGTIFLVFLFFLPVMTGRHGIFVDDERQHNYPNQLFQASCLQKGIIPLWDPHTFAGGLPFYTRAEDFAFYPVQWLFGLLGETTPSFRSFQVLVIFPIVLHFLWAAAGAFFLGRWGVGLSRMGSMALALIFTLSTSMVGGMLMHPMTLSLSWHPWLLAVVIFYVRRRSAGRLLLGVAVVALAGPAYANYSVHGLMLALFLGAAVVLRCWCREGAVPALRLGVGLLAMGVLGLMLAAPFWLAVIEGAGYVGATFRIDYEFLTGGPRSVPWRWLPTVFIPELFGSTNFAYFWGAAKDHHMYWCEGALTRGMLLWLPAVLAIWLAVFRGGRTVRRRTGPGSPVLPSPSGAVSSDRAGTPPGLLFWTWFATGVLVFSLLMLIGRFSPFFGLLYRLGPIFRIPYATRWHTTFTTGLALLSGIGVHRLWMAQTARKVVTRRWIAGYIIFVTLSVLAVIGLPPGYWNKLSDPGWFFLVPGLYWLICLVLLGTLCLWWPRRWVGKIIVILALAGLFRSAFWVAYRPMGMTWAPEQDSARGPEDSDLFRFMEYASRFNSDPMLRTGYSLVFADNGALVYGGYSLLGVGVKPMIPRVYHTLAEICEGMPNETILRDPSLPFVRNMATGFWWHAGPSPPPEEWKYMTEIPNGQMTLFRLPGVLPRIYTQDRFCVAPEKEACHDLIYRDLRELAILDEDDRAAAQYLPGRTGPVPGEAFPLHFERLQKRNRIRRVDLSEPNTMEIECDVTAPAMLIITDVWHPGWRASDNGRPVKIHRVNYIQRGIWMKKGSHLVRLGFLPTCVTIGRWFSLAAFGFCVIYVGLVGWRRRNSTGKK